MMEPTQFYTILLAALAVAGSAFVASRLLLRSRSKTQELEQVLRDMLQHHSDMVAVTDNVGVIISASSHFYEYWSQTDSHEQLTSVTELFGQRGQHDYHSILEYIRREKKPLIDHKVSLVYGDDERELDLTVVPVLDSSSHILNLIHILRPTREKSELATDMSHLEKLTNMGRIAAGMAHELNTPLGSIILATDIIGEQLGNAPSALDELARIRSHAEHCSKVVKQLLSYVRKDEQHRSEQSVKTIIEKVQQLLSAEAKKRNISIEVGSTPERPVILCNENQIEQLLFNLLSNAFHAIESDGSITVEIEHDNLLNQLTCSIADTGCGIPEEQIEKIFDPFFTTKPGKEGTGLGLAICRKIMIEHGGRITVESCVGEGTVFRLYFPIEK